MAQQYEFNPYDGDNLNKFIDAKLARQKASTDWYDPTTGNHHLSLTNSRIPDFTGPVIANGNKIREAKEKFKAGSINQDSATFYGYNSEFVDDAVKVYDYAAKVKRGEIGKLQAGAVLTTKDYTSTAIVNQILSQEVIDLTYRDYNLMSAVNTTNVNTLEVALPDQITQTGSVTMGLNEFDLPESAGVAYTQQTTRLKKSGARIDVSIWFDMISRRRDVEADIKQFINLDWDKQYNTEIASVILAPMVDVAFSDELDVLAASGRNTIIPQKEINAAAVLIRNAGGTPNTLVMNSATYYVLISNTWMGEGGFYEQSGQALGPDFNKSRNVTHPKLPGYKIIIDETIVADSIYLFDARTAKWYNGPTRTANYEDTLGSFRGTIMEKWYGALLWIAGFAKELTGAIT
jgi:hypothetical protein